MNRDPFDDKKLSVKGGKPKNPKKVTHGDIIQTYSDGDVIASFHVVKSGKEELNPLYHRDMVLQPVDVSMMTEEELLDISPEYVDDVKIVQRWPWGSKPDVIAE